MERGHWQLEQQFELESHPDPNSPTFNVIFNNGGSLTLDGDRNIGSYSQTGGTFTITGNQRLAVWTSGSSGALGGGGVINLGYSFISQGGAGNVLFTNTNGTIQGYGEIGFNGLSLLNQSAGIIQANVAGQTLTFNGGGTFTNNGLMRARNGGALIFNGAAGATFTNNATIRSENASNVIIQDGTLIGGTLDNSGSSGAITLTRGTLRDVTIAAGSTVTDNIDGQLEHKLINRGTLSDGSATTLQVASDTTLSGGGVIALGQGFLQNNGSNRTLTNTNNVLRGFGEIGRFGLSVINSSAGIIQADVSGQTLTLNGNGTFTNNGLMRARNGGALIFNGAAGATFTNNATIRSENASNVIIQDGTLIGGTLDNSGSSGAITLTRGTLRNVTIAAGSTVTDNIDGQLESTLINRGTLSDGSATTLQIASDTTLSGGGVIALGLGFLQNNGSNRTLINTDNVLRGFGEIGRFGLSIINGAAGSIQADVSGQTLFLNGSGTFTNNGLFVAQNGGALRQSSGTLTNFSGNTLTGGTWMVIDQGGGTTLALNIGPIATNAGTIILDGANAQLLDSSNTNAVDTLASNQGSLQLLHGKLLTTSAQLSSSGDLLVGAGSALTVAGPLQVDAGTLRGAGKIVAPVSIGKQTGAGALLAPGDSDTGTLTIKGSLTFQAKATYNCELNFHTAKADKVVAKVVGINSGAQFSFLGLKNGVLTPGTVFTVISSTSKRPIGGAFSNLADGSTFSAKSNTFQVSYEGGDGNDLTLTVVP